VENNEGAVLTGDSSTESTASAAVETPAQTTESTGVEGVEAAAPAFAANFKFNIHNKEHEIPEKFRSLITDAESEKEVRELFEKAMGLDYAKPKHLKTQKEFEDYKKNSEPTLKALQRVSDMYNAGDYQNFFKALKISDEVLYKYVLDKLNYNELTPEQKRERDQQVAQKQQMYAMEDQTVSVQSQYESLAIENREFQLESVLARPDTVAMQEAFDSAHGAGAFKTAIIDRGDEVFRATGRDLPVVEVIQQVWRTIAPFVKNQPQAGAAPGQRVIPANGKPPVIPNISGRNTSPTKKLPTSTDDLRKLAREMRAAPNND
jgi:hypothetical protein